MREIYIIALIAAAPGIVTAVLTWLNGRQMTVIHNQINSRMDQLLEINKKSSRAEGVEEGKQSR